MGHSGGIPGRREKRYQKSVLRVGSGQVNMASACGPVTIFLNLQVEGGNYAIVEGFERR
jgi:hypothetical protein